MGTVPRYMGIARHGIKARQVDKRGNAAFYHKWSVGGTCRLQGYSLQLHGKDSSGACWRRCLVMIMGLAYLNQLETSITR